MRSARISRHESVQSSSEDKLLQGELYSLQFSLFGVEEESKQSIAGVIGMNLEPPLASNSRTKHFYLVYPTDYKEKAQVSTTYEVEVRLASGLNIKQTMWKLDNLIYCGSVTFSPNENPLIRSKIRYFMNKFVQKILTGADKKSSSNIETKQTQEQVAPMQRLREPYHCLSHYFFIKPPPTWFYDVAENTRQIEYVFRHFAGTHSKLCSSESAQAAVGFLEFLSVVQTSREHAVTTFFKTLSEEYQKMFVTPPYSVDSVIAYIIEAIGLLKLQTFTERLGLVRPIVNKIIEHKELHFGYFLRPNLLKLENPYVQYGLKKIFTINPQMALQFYDNDYVFRDKKEFFQYFDFSNPILHKYLIQRLPICQNQIGVNNFRPKNVETLAKLLIWYAQDLDNIIEVSIALSQIIWNEKLNDTLSTTLKHQLGLKNSEGIIKFFLEPYLHKILDIPNLRKYFMNNIREITIGQIDSKFEQVIDIYSKYPDILNVLFLKSLLDLTDNLPLQLHFRQLMLISLQFDNAIKIPIHFIISNFNNIIKTYNNLSEGVSLLIQFAGILEENPLWKMIESIDIEEVIKRLVTLLSENRVAFTLHQNLMELQVMHISESPLTPKAIQIGMEVVKISEIDENSIMSLAEIFFIDQENGAQKRIIDQKFAGVAEQIFSKIEVKNKLKTPDIFDNESCYTALIISKELQSSAYMQELESLIKNLIERMTNETITLEQIDQHVVKKPKFIEPMITIIDPSFNFDRFGNLHSCIEAFNTTNIKFQTILQRASQAGISISTLQKQLTEIIESFNTFQANDVQTGWVWRHVFKRKSFLTLEKYYHFRGSKVFDTYFDPKFYIQDNNPPDSVFYEIQELDSLCEFDLQSENHIFSKLNEIIEDLMHSEDVEALSLYQLWRNILPSEVQSELAIIESFYNQEVQVASRQGLKNDLIEYCRLPETLRITEQMIKLQGFIDCQENDMNFRRLLDFRDFAISFNTVSTTTLKEILTNLRDVEQVLSQIQTSLNESQLELLHQSIDIYMFTQQYENCDILQIYIDYNEAASSELTYAVLQSCIKTIELFRRIRKNQEGQDAISQLRNVALTLEERLVSSYRGDFDICSVNLENIKTLVRKYRDEERKEIMKGTQILKLLKEAKHSKQDLLKVMNQNYFLAYLPAQSAMNLAFCVYYDKPVYKHIQKLIDLQLIDRSTPITVVDEIMGKNKLVRLQELFCEHDLNDLESQRIPNTSKVITPIRSQVQYRLIPENLSQFNAALTLYATAGYKPRLHDTIECTSNTLSEEIEAFVIRAIRYNQSTGKDRDRVFLILNFQSLTKTVQRDACNMMRQLHNEKKRNYCLYIFSKLTNAKELLIEDAFDKSVCFSIHKDSISQEYSNVWRNKLGNVIVVISSVPGFGKTTKIQELAMQKEQRLVRFSVSGRIDKKKLIILHNKAIDEFAKDDQGFKSIAFHYDIDYASSLEDLNSFLFQLVVQGIIIDGSDKSRSESIASGIICTQIDASIYIELSSNMNNYRDQLIITHFQTQTITYSGKNSIDLSKLENAPQVCRYLEFLDQEYEYDPDSITRANIEFEQNTARQRTLLAQSVANKIVNFNFRKLRSFMSMFSNQIAKLVCNKDLTVPIIEQKYDLLWLGNNNTLKAKETFKEMVQEIFNISLRLSEDVSTDDSIKDFLHHPFLCLYGEKGDLVPYYLPNHKFQQPVIEYLEKTQNQFFQITSTKSPNVINSIKLKYTTQSSQIKNFIKYSDQSNQSVDSISTLHQWWQHLYLQLRLSQNPSLLVYTSDIFSMKSLVTIYCKVFNIIFESKLCTVVLDGSPTDGQKLNSSIVNCSNIIKLNQDKKIMIFVQDQKSSSTELYRIVKEIMTERTLNGVKIMPEIYILWVCQKEDFNPIQSQEYSLPSTYNQIMGLKSYSCIMNHQAQASDELIIDKLVSQTLDKLFPGQNQIYSQFQLSSLLTNIHTYIRLQLNDIQSCGIRNALRFFTFFIHSLQSMGELHHDLVKSNPLGIKAAVHLAVDLSYRSQFNMRNKLKFDRFFYGLQSYSDRLTRTTLQEHKEKFVLEVSDLVKRKQFVMTDTMLETLIAVKSHIETKQSLIIQGESLIKQGELINQCVSGAGKTLAIEVIREYYRSKRDSKMLFMRFGGLHNLTVSEFKKTLAKAYSLHGKAKCDVVLILDDLTYDNDTLFKEEGYQILHCIQEEVRIVIICLAEIEMHGKLSGSKQLLPVHRMQSPSNDELQQIFNSERGSQFVKEAISWFKSFNDVFKENNAVNLYSNQDFMSMMEKLVKLLEDGNIDNQIMHLKNSVLSVFGYGGLGTQSVLKNLEESLHHKFNDSILDTSAFLQNSLLSREHSNILLICSRELDGLSEVTKIYKESKVQYHTYFGENGSEIQERAPQTLMSGAVCVIVGNSSMIPLLLDFQYQKYQQSRIIIIMKRDDACKIQRHILGRFLKIQLTSEPARIDRDTRILVRQVQEWVQNLSYSSMPTMFPFNVQSLEYITSLVKRVKSQSEPSQALNQCKNEIIHLATLKGIISISSDGNRELLNEYLSSNLHFNFKSAIKQCFAQQENEQKIECRMHQIITYSDFQYLKDSIKNMEETTIFDFTLSPQLSSIREQVKAVLQSETSNPLIFYFGTVLDKQQMSNFELARWLINEECANHSDLRKSKGIFIVLRMPDIQLDPSLCANDWHSITIDHADGQGDFLFSGEKVFNSSPIELLAQSYVKLKLYKQELNVDDTFNKYSANERVLRKQKISEIFKNEEYHQYISEMLAMQFRSDKGESIESSWPLSISQELCQSSLSFLDFFEKDYLTKAIQLYTPHLIRFFENEGLTNLFENQDIKLKKLFDFAISLAPGIFRNNQDDCIRAPLRETNAVFPYFNTIQQRFGLLQTPPPRLPSLYYDEESKSQTDQTSSRSSQMYLISADEKPLSLQQQIELMTGEYLKMYPDLKQFELLKIENQLFFEDFVKSIEPSQEDEQKWKLYQNFMKGSISITLFKGIKSKIEVYAVFQQYFPIFKEAWNIVREFLEDVIPFKTLMYVKFQEKLSAFEEVIEKTNAQSLPIDTYTECFIQMMTDLLYPSANHFNDYEVWIQQDAPLQRVLDFSTQNCKSASQVRYEIQALKFMRELIIETFQVSRLSKDQKNVHFLEFSKQFKVLQDKAPNLVIELILKLEEQLTSIDCDAKQLEIIFVNKIGLYLNKCPRTSPDEMAHYLSIVQIPDRSYVQENIEFQEHLGEIVAILLSQTDLQFNLEFLKEEVNQLRFKSKTHKILNELLCGVSLNPGSVKPLGFIVQESCSPITYKHPLVHRIMSAFEKQFQSDGHFSLPQELKNQMFKSSKNVISECNQMSLHHVICMAYFRCTYQNQSRQVIDTVSYAMSGIQESYDATDFNFLFGDVRKEIERLCQQYAQGQQQDPYPVDDIPDFEPKKSPTEKSQKKKKEKPSKKKVKKQTSVEGGEYNG